MARRNPTGQLRASRRKPSAAAAGTRAPSRPPAQVETSIGPIIGIGASAGGLEAFRTFFAAVPPDTGMAFVLVQHLDPHHESMLVDLVRKFTSMTVSQAEDGMPLAPDRVFVVPPNATLTIEHGAFRVTQPAPPRGQRLPIDAFLESLAADRGDKSVGIILAGSGSDGTQGVKAIKEHGGITFAQAEFDAHARSGMPASAVTGGFIDYVLPVEEIPARLIAYWEHRASVDSSKNADGVRPDVEKRLPAICDLLRDRLGHDFSRYKTKTLARRIQRRMQLLQIDDIDAYIAALAASPEAQKLLVSELLIGVTHFFRDGSAFAALAGTFAASLAKDANEPIRIWVPGCSTGEEAYSIAIMVREIIADAAVKPRVQIFATDVDDRAVLVGRAGRYSEGIVGDVGPERLARNFSKEGNHYRVVPEVRALCVFSRHDIIADPPFSRLNLISCRNLFIYLKSDVQKRLVALFHYALRPGGYLFLGSSETIADQGRLFADIDKKHHIFRRRDAVATRQTHGLLPGASGRIRAPLSAQKAHDDSFRQHAERLVAKYGPAYVIVDQNHDVLWVSGQIGRFLEPSQGAASLNLFSLLQVPLRAAARAALRQADADDQGPVHDTLALAIADQRETINLIVERLPDERDETHVFVVIFQPVGIEAQIGREHGHRGDGEPDAPSDARLRKELATLRRRLRTVTDELEVANEEMQSSNEEFQTVNEELQSTNEELETSKEELHSINEELQSANIELATKNDALVRASSDLVNLFESTAIATVFLDTDLLIRRFTPAVAEIFNVRAGDEGRPITDIVSRLDYGDLRHDVLQVLESRVTVEREVRIAERDTTYLMRVRPYRNTNGVIDGVAATFVDISDQQKRAHDQARLAAIVESSQDAIISHGVDGTITSWNSAAERMFGFAAADVLGRTLSSILPDDSREAFSRMLAVLELGGRSESTDISLMGTDGLAFEVSLSMSPVIDPQGRLIGAATIARNVTDLRSAERQRDLLLNELDHRVKNVLQIVSSVASRTLKTADTPEDFFDAFTRRIAAISRTHGMLTRKGNDEVPLAQLVASELAPFENKAQIGVKGPEIVLEARAALMLGMTLHELATNAAKFGALSRQSGHLDVTWSVSDIDGIRMLQLMWVESAGPAVEEPKRRGFGSELIEQGLAHGFGGLVTREFHPAGVTCTIRLPLTRGVGREGAGADRPTA